MNWPIPGAMTGMAMNTMKISDITSAMRRPSNVSRTIDAAMTRVAAAPMPCTSRHSSRMANDGAMAAAAAATT